MISKSTRDTLIIVGILVLVVVGYLVLNRPDAPPVQASSEFDHPEVEGMDKAAMGSMINLPGDYNSLVQFGNEVMDQRNYPLAAEAYKRALAIKGDDPHVRTDYGACLHGMGLAVRALQEFHTVLRDNPEHSIATFNIGIVYYNEQHFDSAKVYWEKFLLLEPESEIAGTVKQYLQKIDG